MIKSSGNNDMRAYKDGRLESQEAIVEEEELVSYSMPGRKVRAAIGCSERPAVVH